jgi:hypothetical protein
MYAVFWSGRFHLEVPHVGQADGHHDRERAVLKPRRPCLFEAKGQSYRLIELATHTTGGIEPVGRGIRLPK